jgi:hypothetical protein
MEIQVVNNRFMEVNNPGSSVGFGALSGKARRWVAWTYFSVLSTVCLGSSTILRVPAGALR